MYSIAPEQKGISNQLCFSTQRYYAQIPYRTPITEFNNLIARPHSDNFPSIVVVMFVLFTYPSCRLDHKAMLPLNSSTCAKDPSRGQTYPTWGKGKSSKVPQRGISFSTKIMSRDPTRTNLPIMLRQICQKLTS